MPRVATLVWLLVSFFVVGIALFVRLDGLGEPSLWYDEVLHLEKAWSALQEPLNAWFTGLSIDRENGPLFYATQLLALQISNGEVAVRLMPAMVGVTTVIVMGALGFAATGSRTAAIVAATLLAMSPLHVYFSREGRPYAAVMLMASLMLLLLLLRDRRWTVPAAYAISILTAYLGAVAAPVLIAFAMLSLADWIFCRRPRTPWPGHFLTAALAGLAVILLIFPAAERLSTSRIPPDFIVTHPLSAAAFDRLLASMTVSGVDWATSRPASYMLLALAAWGVFAVARQDKCRALHITGMFVLPVAGWMALLVILNRWYLVRYTSAGLPAFLLLVAVALTGVTEGIWRRLTSDAMRNRYSWVPSLVAISLTAVVSIFNWHAVRTESWQKPNWRGLAEMIGLLTTDDEPLIAHNKWSATCIRHYLDRTNQEVEVLNAKSDLNTAKQMATEHEGAWVLSAGFERALDFRNWMRTQDLVYRGQLANLRLFYSPNFPAFVAAPGRASTLKRILESQDSSGNRLDFSASELLLGAGWSYPEASQDGTKFRWATAEKAEIGLLVSRPRKSSLRLRLYPFPAASLPPQTLEAHLNGEPLGRLQLEPGWNDYEIQVPAQLWQAGTNLVTFQFGWLLSPAALDASANDQRSLAVAFDFAEAVGADLNP